MFFLLPLPSVGISFISTTVRVFLLFSFLLEKKRKSKQKRKENPPQRLIVLTRCKAPLRLFCFPLLFRLISVILYYTARLVWIRQAWLVSLVEPHQPSSGIRASVSNHTMYTAGIPPPINHCRLHFDERHLPIYSLQKPDWSKIFAIW